MRHVGCHRFSWQQELLQCLASNYQSVSSLWVWAGVDTIEIVRLVQGWRTLRNAVLHGAARVMLSDQRWELALVAPVAEEASVVCRQLFDTGRDFACLVPSDLVNWIALGSGRVADEKDSAEGVKIEKDLFPGPSDDVDHQCQGTDTRLRHDY